MRRDEHGISLIEALAALGIASLVAVLLLGALAFSGGAWTRSAAIGDATSEIYASQTVLRRLALNFSNATGGARFGGDERSLAFTTRFAMPGAAPAAMEAGLALGTCEGEICLTLALARAGSPEVAGDIVRTPLVRGVVGLDIAYLAPDGWRKSWSVKDGAPRLVRILVQFAKRDPRRWPPLFLAPGGA